MVPVARLVSETRKKVHTVFMPQLFDDHWVLPESDRFDSVRTTIAASLDNEFTAPSAIIRNAKRNSG